MTIMFYIVVAYAFQNLFWIQDLEIFDPNTRLLATSCFMLIFTSDLLMLRKYWRDRHDSTPNQF